MVINFFKKVFEWELKNSEIWGLWVVGLEKDPEAGNSRTKINPKVVNQYFTWLYDLWKNDLLNLSVLIVLWSSKEAIYDVLVI